MFFKKSRDFHTTTWKHKKVLFPYVGIVGNNGMRNRIWRKILHSPPKMWKKCLNKCVYSSDPTQLRRRAPLKFLKTTLIKLSGLQKFFQNWYWYITLFVAKSAKNIGRFYAIWNFTLCFQTRILKIPPPFHPLCSCISYRQNEVLALLHKRSRRKR